jgi:hypothetical protein
MSIAFMSVAFGHNPGKPMKPDSPAWIIERQLSPGSEAAKGRPGNRYRH